MDNRNMVADATTTAEQNRVTKRQSNINFMWEITQSVIAILVTLSMIFCQIKGIESRALDGAFTLIIAIYFVRMNHQKIGGIGGTDTR